MVERCEFVASLRVECPKRCLLHGIAWFFAHLRYRICLPHTMVILNAIAICGAILKSVRNGRPAGNAAAMGVVVHRSKSVVLDWQQILSVPERQHGANIQPGDACCCIV